MYRRRIKNIPTGRCKNEIKKIINNKISNNKTRSNKHGNTLNRIRNKIIITAMLISALILVSCETEPPKPTNPIFSDVEKVEITGTGPYYFDSFPSYVKYIQFLVFDTAPVADDDDKIIKIWGIY